MQHTLTQILQMIGARYTPQMRAREQLIESIGWHIRRVHRKTEDVDITNQFVDDIELEMRERTGQEEKDEAYNAIASDKLKRANLVQDTERAATHYTNPTLRELLPIHNHLISQRLATPFESAELVTGTTRNTPTEIETILRVFNAASRQARATTYFALAHDTAMHRTYARADVRDPTFARFLERSEGLTAPDGSPLRTVVTGMPEDQRFDANVTYFVEHPRMLALAPDSAELVNLARTHPLAYMLADAHRNTATAPNKEAIQDAILALRHITDPVQIRSAIEALRQSKTTTIKRDSATYVPREKPVKETNVKTAEEKQTEPVPETSFPTFDRGYIIVGGPSTEERARQFGNVIRNFEVVYVHDAPKIERKIASGDAVIVLTEHRTRRLDNVRDAAREAGAFYIQTPHYQPHVVQHEILRRLGKA